MPGRWQYWPHSGRAEILEPALCAVDVQALLKQNEAARERAAKRQALVDERRGLTVPARRVGSSSSTRNYGGSKPKALLRSGQLTSSRNDGERSTQSSARRTSPP